MESTKLEDFLIRFACFKQKNKINSFKKPTQANNPPIIPKIKETNDKPTEGNVYVIRKGDDS